jgi:Spx/MgsR family transcriptional regulator
MAAITVYGIPNCDTIKKAFNWFKKQKIEIDFWDYKRSGITKEKLTGWCKQVSWEILLNKKSTTWRSLSLPVQEKITSQAAAIKLMIENTSIIKRPVVEYGDNIFIGFDEEKFSKQFSK